MLTDHRSTAQLRSGRSATTPARQSSTKAIGERVSLVGGIRFENNGSFGFYAAPRDGGVVAPQPGSDALGSTRVRGSAGRGIKEPTVLSVVQPVALLPGQSRFEAGTVARVRCGHGAAIRAGIALAIEAAYFANHFDDLISLGPFDPVTFVAQYENIGETRASGLELSAPQSFVAGFEWAARTRCSIPR